MSLRFLARAVGLAAIAVLAACAQGPTQVAPDTYMVSKRSTSGGFYNTDEVRAELSREAEAFAKGRGQRAELVAFENITAEPGRPARAEYRFRVVDLAGAPARRAPAAAAGGAGVAPAAASQLGPDQTRALLNDLNQLDELRKRGVINQAEFDDLKKRILNRP